MKHKKNKKNYWNYRVVTKLFIYNPISSLPTPLHDRLFSITEVYYNENGKPDSYVEPESVNVLFNQESIKDLKWIRKKFKKALKRPILDLDNFPNIWEPTE
jgi:hypothetical protein